MMTPEELIRLAKEARSRAYMPYSGFSVGAALLCRNGKVYQGCNIENAAYGPSVCAERVAVFKAVYDGERAFEAIAVVGGRAGAAVTGLCPPCGVCRQVLREFCGPDLMIYLAGEDDRYEAYSLDEMLPHSFSNAEMNQSFQKVGSST